ncbi:MAG TPA: SusC/RagA family TonB-linked outer membrane protein [Bacteroidales bacterium]|nr:SusC/RagA family TonB-linked outer membrane protein [Bacteroidales bacterium]
MTKLCVLFFTCVVTLFTTGNLNVSAGDISNENFITVGFEEQQQFTVTGTVTDASTGEPMAGVTVLVKGTSTGRLTDENGKFTIVLPAREAVLQFSFVGYSTQEMSVTAGSNISVRMQTEEQRIEEVVVVGYGVQKKESVVGAITQVSNATLMQAGAATITNAIAGKLSGVLTIQQRGEPGNNAAEIYVRGVSSWNGSAPLVLVDGVERDFSQLDPNEINTISVLKDASATAVFGAKGANGVILVTTKRGTLGKPKMDLSLSYGLLRATRIPEHIDSYTTMSMYNVALMNEGGTYFSQLIPEWQLQEYKNPSTPLNSLRFPNVNWFEECTHPFSPTAVASLNISGGTEFAKYFLNLGFQHESSFFIGLKEGYMDSRFWNQLFNYRINVDFSITKTTTISLNAGGSLNTKNTPSNASWRNLYSTGPSRFPAYFPEWALEMVPDPDYPEDKNWRRAQAFGEYTGNPYTNLTQGSFNRDLGSRLFTDLLFKQDLGWITEGLSVNGKVALSTYYNNRQLTLSYTFPEYQLYYDLIPQSGQFNPSTGRLINPWYRAGEGNEYYKLGPYDINVGGLNSGYYRDLYYEASVNYARTFGKHSISGLGLFNRQEKNQETNFPYYNEAWVGRATYDFDRKYLFEFNIGYTGSERFAPANRFGTFPSIAIGWVVSEENFFKAAVPWVNRLKLRYSDGYVGSDYARSRWLYTSSYYKDARGYIREDLGANTRAQWERAHKRDLGIEIGLFKNLITLNVDLFDEYRDKMLLTPKSVTFLVGNSFKELNLGKMKKHGIEAELEFRKTVNPNFTYFIRGMFSANENRVLFKDDEPYAPEHRKQEGKPLTSMMFAEAGVEGTEINGVQLTGTGYYTTIDDIHNNVSPIALNLLRVGDYKFLDFDADGAVTPAGDKYPIKGLTYPPIVYSLGSGFTWKNFDFNFLFSGNHGKYVQYNQLYEVEFIKGDWRVHKSQLDYWTPVNQDANHSTLHYAGSSSSPILFWGGGEADRGYQIMIENRFFRKANYLRLKDVYLSYTIRPGALKNSLGISNFVVYVTGNNLFTLTKLPEGDPEATNFQQGFYPIIASVRLGVKLNF